MAEALDKNTGRYYTDAILADFLASLAEPFSREAYAIDPMVGSGNLIEALLRHDIDPARVYGIDVDSQAIDTCKKRLRKGHFLCRNAFDESCVPFYLQHEWNVVIANPPFVRRERLSSTDTHAVDPVSIKTSLMKVLREIKATEPILEAATTYNSYSDLAIPSAILCAALVKEGGTLALVLPEACLKRSYGKPLRQLLSSEFDIQALVEDASRAWFKDAQVKTCLLVAKKAEPSSEYKNIVIDRSLSAEGSLLGKMNYRGKQGYEALSLVFETRDNYVAPGISVRNVKQADLLSQTPVSAVSSRAGLDFSFLDSTLEDWDLRAGQGLRTGANDFFYLEKSGNGFSNKLIRQVDAEQTLSSHCEALAPVLKEQADIGGIVDASKLKHRLLLLKHPMNEVQLSSSSDRDLIQSAISFAEKNPVQSKGRLKLIPEMSAVRTNGPKTDTASERYWYMIPQLHMRHTPDLAIPRIAGRSIRVTLLPSDHSIICDANFITIWQTTEILPREAAVALFSSSLIQLQLECLCTVMGGGALKIESTDLKQLLLPKPTPGLVRRLAQIGRQLISQDSFNEAAIDSIDYAIRESCAQDSGVNVPTVNEVKTALQTLRETRTDK